MDLGSPLQDRRTALAIVVAVAGLVFANALANGFAYDDAYIVVTNTGIQSLGSIPGALLQPYWPGDYGRELGLWRPVTTALLGLQYAIGGGGPFVFHLFNVLAHMGASALVLLLLAELMPLSAAFAAGLLFAVHPVHVEAVANVIGVSEILSAAALLGAALVHVRSGPRSSWRAALAVGLLYALGFGSKESGVTLPGVIFLLDAARGRLGFAELPAYLRDRWRVYAVMLLVAVGTLVGRHLVLGSIANPFAPLGGDLLREIPRIWTLAEVWTHYVRLWVFPLDLSADYSPNVIPVSIGWNAANTVGALLAILVLGMALAAWRKGPMERGTATARAAGFGVVWFVITISPISNAIFLSGVLLAERTLYLPSVGMAAATGWLIVRLSRERPRGAWVMLVVALALAGMRTWTRTPTWKDNSAMFNALLGDYPQSGRSQWILGDEFLRAGRVSQALQSYRAAIDILGPHYQLLTEISKQLMDVQNYRAAETLLTFAAEGEPEFPLAWGLLALIRAEHGDAEATERLSRTSLELWTVDPTRRHLLAWSLAAQGRLEEAREERARAEAQGMLGFWPRHVFDAYVSRDAGDTARTRAALDSAWAAVATGAGRATVDSVIVTDFGLQSRLDTASVAPDPGNR